jgi:ribonuclease III
MNNLANKLISEEELEEIINKNLKNSKIKVNNVGIYRQAFVHKSFNVKESFVDEEDSCCAFYMEKTSCNERLEFLGDSVLNMVTAEYLFELFPDYDEGFLTKLRTKLVRNTQLSHIGTELGFKEWLLISSYVEKINGRENPRLIEDVFESFIASLYKDQGFYVTREFIFSCFDTYVDINFLINNNDNYKDILLRYFQLNNWSHPEYDTFISDTANSVKSFTTAVLVRKDLCLDLGVEDIDKKFGIEYKVCYGENHYILGVGTGKTKKESEQQASKSALLELKVPSNF